MRSMALEAARALAAFKPTVEQNSHYLYVLDVDGIGMPLCPNCFMQGRAVRMSKKHVGASFGAARCVSCRMTLEWEATSERISQTE